MGCVSWCVLDGLSVMVVFLMGCVSWCVLDGLCVMVCTCAMVCTGDLLLTHVQSIKYTP